MAKLSEVATAMGIVIDKFVNTPVKNQLDRQKLELEIVKLESKIKDSQPEEEAEDNFMDALNAVADDVWEDSQEKEWAHGRNSFKCLVAGLAEGQIRLEMAQG